MIWELILIPILTTLFTTIVLYVKETRQSKKKTKRTITEQKLVELFNALFSKSLLYLDKLESSFFITPKGMFDLNGELAPIKDTEGILETKIWDDVIKETREIIHNKLHLLEDDDKRQWHFIENIRARRTSFS